MKYDLLKETSPSKKLSGPNFSCFRSHNCRFWSQSAGQNILSKVIFSLNLSIFFNLGKIWPMRRWQLVNFRQNFLMCEKNYDKFRIVTVSTLL
jgi:hypothetical protein